MKNFADPKSLFKSNKKSTDANTMTATTSALVQAAAAVLAPAIGLFTTSSQAQDKAPVEDAAPAQNDAPAQDSALASTSAQASASNTALELAPASAPASAPDSAPDSAPASVPAPAMASAPAPAPAPATDAASAPAPTVVSAPNQTPAAALAPAAIAAPAPNLAEASAQTTDSNNELAVGPSTQTMSVDMMGNRHVKLLKHPLQNVWTLWYLENDRTKSWEDMQNEITSFDTVEDFWSLYNHIKPPSEIKVGSDYSLFKKDIRPMWEDAANNNGGRWVITLNKILKDELDKLWLDVLLCLIGEVFDNLDQICGAVVNIRGKNNKISIWTSNGNNQKAILEIGHKLRDALCLGPQNVLQYQLHKDTMVKQGSNVKTTYTL